MYTLPSLTELEKKIISLLFLVASIALQSEESVSFFQGLKLVMNHGPYIKLIAGFLFTSLAFMVSKSLVE